MVILRTSFTQAVKAECGAGASIALLQVGATSGTSRDLPLHEGQPLRENRIEHERQIEHPIESRNSWLGASPLDRWKWPM